MYDLILPLTFMYIIWIAASFAIMGAGIVFKTVIPPDLAGPLSLLFFVILASCQTAFFMIRAEPILQNRHRLRQKLLSASFILGSVLYYFVRLRGGTPSCFVFILGTANLLVFANLLGTWIVTPLKRPAELFPLCLVMSLADIFSVVGGPTSEIAGILEKYYKSGMTGQVPAGDFIVIKIVIPGLPNMVPVFGLADWVIIAFLTASAVRFKMNDNPAGKSVGHMVRSRRVSFYLPAGAFGLIAAVFAAHFFKLFLPALPMIAFFFLVWIMIKYPEARHLNRQDWRLVWFTVAVMACLMAVRYFF